jgi:ABC-type branched-subunit amino acid transport system ATPase component
MSVLVAHEVSKSFGGLRAIDGVSLSVARGEIHALIGPNGAGKTTFLNLVTRIHRPDAGALRFDGHDLVTTAPHDVARLGLKRIFQHVELFEDLTVLDNVLIGGHVLGHAGVLDNVIRSRAARQEEGELLQRARDALDFVGLGRLAPRIAGTLTGGQARLLGLARALVSGPQMVLLDELVAGLNSQERYEAALLVRRLRDERGITIMLIEHDMQFVMSAADQVSVLDFGRIIARGTPAQVRADPAVIEAYLGAGSHAHA